MDGEGFCLLPLDDLRIVAAKHARFREVWSLHA
jgi:hypothetical protein